MSGLIGILGSILFLASWVVQAWETRQSGQAVVTFRFFAIRLAASVLLLVEAWRVQSYGFLCLVAGSIVLIVYNLYVIKYGSIAGNRPPA
jgi:lipid-A-disaccharide synthase-like uncharacterized protein